ncbi:MAG: hypothetical protein Ct9H90mP2_00590 [Dehalococcoidia bacterium]|nr:MAG: hypothetical protein Ct9H90mP2_00590 [Dehalococcoidia bacterium]
MIALTTNLIVGILIMAIVGACGASFDAVQWTYLQKNVPSNLRRQQFLLGLLHWV